MDSSWAYGIVPKSEPGLEALSEWLSGALRRHKGTRVGIWAGCVGGSSGFAGGATGAIMGASGAHAAPWVYSIPWGIWLVFAGIMTGWLVRALRSDKNAELFGRESSRTITMLANARSRGKLRAALGEAYASQLNEGAKLALRGRGILDSPSMRSLGDGGVWSRATERARNALDAGMLRLFVLATQHGDQPEIDETIAEMRAVVEELSAAEKRHSASLASSGGKSDALRSTLQELKELSKAEEEALSELRISS